MARRIVLPAGVLGAVTVALCFAVPGLAIRGAIVTELFGPKMVRAEVIEKGGGDWRLDRGVIVSVDSTQVTLREADGRRQQIPLSSTTDVIRFGRHLPPSALALRWRVLVTWPAVGPAQSVDVAPGPPIRKAIVTELLGPKMVRAEAIEKGGADWRLDRGVIVSVNSTQVTLREADGRRQQIPLASTTQVNRFGRQLPPSGLGLRWRVLVTWPAVGPAQSVDVEKVPARRTQGLGLS